MNQLIYKKNLEALNAKYPIWAALIDGVKRKKRNFNVEAEQSFMGETILKVTQDGKMRYLNG